MAGRVRIGTCGFAYRHWAGGVFYPAGCPPEAYLSHYATCFDIVEVNATFYHLPSEATLRRWHDATPAHFSFIVKGSRLITHRLRLRDAGAALETFAHRLASLDSKLEAVLWQTPPSLVIEPAVLRSFCEWCAQALPACRHAFEFRHESGCSHAVSAILAAHGYATVIADPPRLPHVPPSERAPFAYVRLHRDATTPDGGYTEAHLRAWAARVARMAAAGDDVYVLFNNDWAGRAPHDALFLMALLAGRI